MSNTTFSNKSICDLCDANEEDGHEPWCPEALAAEFPQPEEVVTPTPPEGESLEREAADASERYAEDHEEAFKVLVIEAEFNTDTIASWAATDYGEGYKAGAMSREARIKELQRTVKLQHEAMVSAEQRGVEKGREELTTKLAIAVEALEELASYHPWSEVHNTATEALQKIKQ